MYEVPPGSENQSLQIYIRDSLTGQPKTGLTAASLGAAAGYLRQGGTPVGFTLVALAAIDSPYTPGGFKEASSALTPGVYRIDPPNPSLATGAGFSTISCSFEGALGEAVLVLLRNPTNNVGPGGYQYTVTLTRAAGGLPIAGASLWVSTDLAGSNVIAGSLTTSAAGQATFMLAAGTYYLWVNAQGYVADNPAAFTLSAAGGQTLALAASASPPSVSTGATHQDRLTAFDLDTRLLDFSGADPDVKNARGTRRAILDAVREFPTLHRWASLRGYGRVALHGSYGEGTVAYDADTLTLTLTGGTFPDWAARGCVRIGDVQAKVDARLGATSLTLKDPVFPADLAEGSSYTLYQDAYTLPRDFVAADDAIAESNWGSLTYVGYKDWVSSARTVCATGTPAAWTIAGDPDVPGRLALHVYPAPDADGTLDFMYYRKPRQIRYFDVSDGAATVNPASPTEVTLTDSVLKADMKGSVLRLAPDASEKPGGRDDPYPFAFEGNIVSVTSSTTCVVDTPAPADLAGVAYRISDPVEVDDLQELALGRAAEKHFAFNRIMKHRSDAHQIWRDALVLAMEGDGRVAASRSSSAGGPYRRRGRPDGATYEQVS